MKTTKETKGNRGSKVMCNTCREKFYKDELIYLTKSNKICHKCNEEKKVHAETYKALIEFICWGFNIKAPTGQQLKSIKKFKDSGLNYTDMHMTLYYIYMVEKRKVEGTSIELIPYYYEKAKAHFEMVEKAKKSASSHVSEPEVVIVSAKKHMPNINRTRIIDISKIV